MIELRPRFRAALEALDTVRAEEVLQRVLAANTSLETVERLIVPVMEELGAEWDAGQLALSQIYMSSRMCEQIVDRLFRPGTACLKPGPRMAVTVLCDYHLLGKRIVYSVMRASGYDILDYGRLEVGDLADRIAADRLEILLVSVLMLPSALKVRELRTALEARQARVRIAVGGAPFLFDAALWREVGADAMGRTATDAVKLVERWTEAS